MMEETAIDRLREIVERKAGRTIRTPKDFDYLHDLIYEQCNELVSVSTLKRIWGYTKYNNTPRTSTLDPIAQFVGCGGWKEFLQSLPHEATEESETTTPPKNDKKHTLFRYASLACIIFLIMGGIGLWAWHTKSERDTTPTSDNLTPPSGKRVLRKGQDCFRTIDDYLPLFGIESGDTAYFRPIPGLHEFFVWGPEYHHPVWHNEGDTTQLMPTITEYWTPLPGEKDYQSAEYIRLANEKLYYERKDKDELRVTFMKDIVEGHYVFLGIYRMNKEKSSTEKTVWQRIADECDLGNIGKLEQLRQAR